MSNEEEILLKDLSELKDDIREERQSEPETEPESSSEVSEDSFMQAIVATETEMAPPSLRTLLRLSWVTIAFLGGATILIAIGVLLYLLSKGSLVTASFWVSSVGMAIFLLTLIFGFQRVD